MSGPAKYRKKPVVVEAWQFDGSGESASAICAAYSDVHLSAPVLLVSTLEGDMIACAGDYIITGVKGERYPCKPDIFAATYEEA
jgi:hypothetical protein